MGGYAPVPQDDAPRTAAEADAQNRIGRENRERVGLSGYGGRSQEELNYYDQQREQRAVAQQQQQERIQTQREQAQQQNEVREVQLERDFASEARVAAQKRSGFTDPTTLGDFGTQQRAFELSKGGMDYEAAVGVAIEEQRLNALTTPDIRDDQYYGNELQKWKQNKVEVSSAFHHLTKDAGVSVKENPYEIQGDLAVESLKGSPNKRSERFSPLSGRMSEYLPGERGLQETQWEAARTGKTPPGSYMRAIEVINNSSGGFATGKVGRPNSPGSDSRGAGGGGGSPGSGDAGGLPAPFKSSVLGVRETTSRQSGALPFVGIVPIISPFLANFMPQQIRREVDVPVTMEIKDYESGQPAYTRAFVDESGRKSDTWTRPVGEPTLSEPVAVGAPKITTKYNPLTGETETTSEQEYQQSSLQQYETVTLPKTAQGVQTLTTITEGKTPFNEAVEERLPAGTIRALETQEAILGGMAERSPVYLSMALGASEVKSMVKEPATAAISYGSGFVFGGVVRGASAVLPRIAKASPVAGKALGIGGKLAGYGLVGMYGLDVAGRSTQGFTNFSPVRVAQRATPIATMEVLPMGVGFMHGNRLPEGIAFVRENVPKFDYSAPSRYQRGQSLMNNEVATLGPNAPRKITEPTAESIQKRPAGYSIAQMQMAYQMKGARIPVPKSFEVPEANNFLYAKEPVAGGKSPGVGVKGFEPSSSVQKMIQSRRPSYTRYDVEPTFGVADNKYLADYGRGKISPVNIDKIPGTGISRLKPEHSLPQERSGKTGRYFMDEKSAGGFGGGGGGVVGNVGSRGGISVDVSSGRLATKSQVRTESFDVSSGIFKSGEDYSISAEGMTLNHLSPNRRARLVEDMQPEVTYSGSIPGVQRPSPDSRVFIAQRIGDINGNRQSQFIGPANLLGERISQRNQQRAVSTRSLTQERIRPQTFTVKPVTTLLSGTALVSRQISSPVSISRQSQFSSTASKQLTSPLTDTRQITRTRQTTTRTPWTDITTVQTPEPPKLPPMWLGDAGGSSGDRQYSPQGSYGWANLNPVGADLFHITGKMDALSFGTTKKRKRSKSIFG